MVGCGLKGTVIMKLHDEHGNEVYVYEFYTYEESYRFVSKIRIDPALIKQECESFEKDYEAYIKLCNNCQLNEELPEGYKIEKDDQEKWILTFPDEGITICHDYEKEEAVRYIWDHYNAIKYDVNYGFINRIKRKFPSLEDIAVEAHFQY